MLVQTGILGHMGAAAIAANSIATIVFQIVSVVVYGSGSAASIFIGKTIGANQDDLLKPMVHSMEVIFLCIGAVTGLLIFLVRNPVLLLYNISGDAKSLALQFMAILSVTVVGTAFQQPCDNGIIRGGGDTKFSLWVNFISMWGIIVPFSALAAFVWQMPAIVVFALLKWDQLYKCIPVVIRLHSWKWIRHVTRD